MEKENPTLDDPMEGDGVAARAGLVAASGSGGPLGWSLGATSATAGRQRKPGRWKRIPRKAPTMPTPTANPVMMSPVTMPTPTANPVMMSPVTMPTPTADPVMMSPVTMPTPTPNPVMMSPVMLSPKVMPPPGTPVMLSPKVLPPPGTKDFRPYLPSFGFILPAGEPRESGETGHQPFKKTFEVVVVRKGSKEEKESMERCNQEYLEKAKRLEEEDENLCDTEEEKVALRAFKAKFVSFYRKLATTRPEDVVLIHKPPSDTQEEHLTAEEMEMEAGHSSWPVCPQAKHFATLALDQYNFTKKMHKFEMSRVLLSKCFSEVDGRTFAHVNFTATTPQQSASHPAKRLFFAELMLIPDLQAYESAEPMRVLNVCTIDDSCFGGCHEMVRDINGPVRKDLDYDRCHACSERIKHPRGAQFVSGHSRTRMPYFSVFPDEQLLVSSDETSRD